MQYRRAFTTLWITQQARTTYPVSAGQGLSTFFTLKTLDSRFTFNRGVDTNGLAKYTCTHKRGGSFDSSLSTQGTETWRTAHRRLGHGIEADINVLRFPPTHVLVGTGASGAILYEIGVIEREWIPGTYEHVIVHAMRARLTYEMKWLTMQYQDGDNDEI